MVEEENLSQQEPILNSPYYGAALSEFRSVYPEKETVLRRVLDEIDKQGVDNLKQYNVPGHEGVVFPYTKVNVTELVGNLLQKDIQPDPERKIVYIVFVGFAYPPAGHPFTPWDMIYDRAIGEFPKVVHPIKEGKVPPEIEVYSLGSPNGLGGNVTEEWIEALKKNRFAEYGKAYSAFMQEMLETDLSNENTRFIFQGMSAGATNAEQTAQQLPGLKGRVRLILDNPAGNHAKLAMLWKFLKLPLGFMGEGFLRMNFDQKTKSAIVAEKDFLSSLKSKIKTPETEAEEKEQNDLKVKAALTDVLNMIKGLPVQYEGIRTFVRRGIYDPTAFDPVRLMWVFNRALQVKEKRITEGGEEKEVTGTIMSTHGNISEVPISQTHLINRYRVHLWAQKLNSLFN